MLLGLGILEIASVYKSIKILRERSEDAIIEISKRGYKVDLENGKDEVIEEVNICDSELEEKPLIYKREVLPAMIPGINLLYAYFKRKKYINNFIKDLESNETLVKFTEEEEKQFKSLEDKENQFLFTLFCITKKYDEEEFLGLNKNSDTFIYSYDFGRQYLEHDSLINLSYNFNDVKRINSVSDGDYKVGKIDGVNIAIIGIETDELMFKRLSFKRDNYQTVYDFNEMSEEEAKNERFVIYPFKEDEKYEKEVNNIIDERNKKEKETKYSNISFMKSKKLVLTNRRY